ncbi:MAG TPA: PAS domain S-box protein, partial [Herpetosiphonaceae bacterium]
MMSTQNIEVVRHQLANQIPPTLEQTAQLLASIDALETLVTSAQQETAQRQDMAAALWASDQRFRAMFEQAAVGMAVVGLDGRWLRVNRRL